MKFFAAVALASLAGVATEAKKIQRPSAASLEKVNDTWGHTVQVSDENQGKKLKPAYPDRYTIEATFEVKAARLEEKLTAYVDIPGRRENVVYYDNLANYVMDYGKNLVWETRPTKDHMACYVSDYILDSEGGMLPDFDKYSYVGKEQCPEDPHATCNKWLALEHVETRTNTYAFWAFDDAENTPHLWHFVGYEFTFTSHYDHYALHYHSFQSGAEESMLTPPSGCSESPYDRVDHHSAVMDELKMVRDAVDRVGKKFDAHVEKHGWTYADDMEKHAVREQTYRKNVAEINKLNRDNHFTTFAVNQFADKEKEELKHILQCAGQSQKNKDWALKAMHDAEGDPDDKGYPLKDTYPPAIEKHKPWKFHQMSGKELPEAVDYRTISAVGRVKDQVACGSCWTFSAAATVETQYFLKYGELVSFAEQHFLDCAWDYSSNGCDGGEVPFALYYAMDAGGIATEDAYGSYENMSDFCRWKPNYSPGRWEHAVIKEVVMIPYGDEEAMKDAVATQGAVGIGYNPEGAGMIYYSSGVYYNEECGHDTGHAVTIVGYGTDPSLPEHLRDYWLVKNSWSEFWGDNGYFKIARNQDNMCGIATRSAYPILA
eukprot:Clim_evm14s220 gene=Clim_evmTU14s220